MATTNFEKLPEEKKQAILKAGILCFGRSGYKKTAISEIAAEAGISKAAIFHYFGTKYALFLYIVKYPCNELMDIFTGGVEDYFESLALFNQAQFLLLKKYPGMYEFMRLAREDAGKEGLEALPQIIKEYDEKSSNTIFGNVNWGKFRDGYDRTTIINLTLWVGNGCLMQLDKTLPLEDICAETMRYLTIIKTALYKPEFL